MLIPATRSGRPRRSMPGWAQAAAAVPAVAAAVCWAGRRGDEMPGGTAGHSHQSPPSPRQPRCSALTTPGSYLTHSTHIHAPVLQPLYRLLTFRECCSRCRFRPYDCHHQPIHGVDLGRWLGETQSFSVRSNRWNVWWYCFCITVCYLALRPSA